MYYWTEIADLFAENPKCISVCKYLLELKELLAALYGCTILDSFSSFLAPFKAPSVEMCANIWCKKKNMENVFCHWS